MSFAVSFAQCELIFTLIECLIHILVNQSMKFHISVVIKEDVTLCIVMILKHS